MQPNNSTFYNLKHYHDCWLYNLSSSEKSANPVESSPTIRWEDQVSASQFSEIKEDHLQEQLFGASWQLCVLYISRALSDTKSSFSFFDLASLFFLHSDWLHLIKTFEQTKVKKALCWYYLFPLIISRVVHLHREGADEYYCWWEAIMSTLGDNANLWASLFLGGYFKLLPSTRFVASPDDRKLGFNQTSHFHNNHHHDDLLRPMSGGHRAQSPSAIPPAIQVASGLCPLSNCGHNCEVMMCLFKNLLEGLARWSNAA